MKTKIKIEFKKPNQSQFLIFTIIIMPFLFGLLFDLFHLPTFLKYSLDICWIGLSVLMIINKRKLVKEQNFLFIWVFCFFIYTLLVYVLNFQSGLYYLWGFRNNFRFYIVFFAFIVFLNSEDVKFYFSLLDKIFWINIAICLVQYFVFNMSGDYLGGLFGVQKGCNGYINIFFVIVATKSIIYYLNNQESIFSCLLKSGAIMIISAFAELKFIFAEFFVIILIAVLFTGFTFRKLLITSGVLLGIWIGTNVLVGIFSDSADALTWEGMLETATNEEGYSSQGDLNRLTTIPIISKKILTTLTQRIFGLGLGNCDTSTFEILNTPFYAQYSGLRYNWFSTAFLFLETGFIGLTLFFGFFVLIFILTFKKVSDNVEENMYRQIAMILSVCCVLFAIYNSSLRMESGYMIYFVLAVPFILQKEKSKSSMYPV